MKSLAASLLLILLSGLAQAADLLPAKRACSTVDLRPIVGPVRNQGNMGWCYANTAADLLGYHFRNSLKGHQVSPISIALEYNSRQRHKQVLDEGGHSDVAIRTYLGSFDERDDLCLQNAEDLVVKGGMSLTLQEKLHAMRKLKQVYDAALSDSRKWKEFGVYWNELKKADSVLFTLSEDKLREILYYSTEQTFPLKLKAEFCKGRSIAVNSSRVRVRSMSLYSSWLPFLTARDLVKEVDKQIGKRNIVGISYLASFVTTPHGDLKDESSHASVVVGRKWNDHLNQCEYLVRNSWGDNCYGYENKNVRCESGHFWITADDLAKTMFGFTYLEEGIGLKWLQSKLSDLQ